MSQLSRSDLVELASWGRRISFAIWCASGPLMVKADFIIISSLLDENHQPWTSSSACRVKDLIDFTRVGQAQDLCQADSRASGCGTKDDMLPTYSNRRARKAVHASTMLRGAHTLVLVVLSHKRLSEPSTANRAAWVLQSICWKMKIYSHWSQSFFFLLQRKRSSALPRMGAQFHPHLKAILLFFTPKPASSNWPLEDRP